MNKNTIVSTLFLLLIVFVWANHNDYDIHGNSARNVDLLNNNSIENFDNNRCDNLRNTWEGIGPWGGDVTSVAICPDTPTTLYAAMRTPYISNDSGETWEIWESLVTYSTSIKIIKTSAEGVCFAAGDANDGLFRSTDNGETWSHITNFPIYYRDITVISIDPSNSNILYVGVTGDTNASNWTQVAKSSDNGDTWSVLDTDIVGITMGISDIAIDPSDSDKIIISCGGGIEGGDVAYSDDGGTSWQNIASTLPTQFPFNDVEIFGDDVYVSGGQLFGSQYVGIFKSQMGVFSWENISTDFPIPVVNKVFVNPFFNNMIYAATEGDGLYVSADGGDTWNFTTSGADNFSIIDLVMNPSNPLDFYIGCKSMAVYKSSDMGLTWVKANHGLASLRVNDIAIDPTNADNIIAGYEAENSGGCYISHDGGDTWDVVENLPATRFSAVAFDNSGNIYACSKGPSTVAQEGVYKSIDGGISWNNTGPDLGPDFETELWEIEISEIFDGLIFVSGNHYGNGGWASTVYRTTNGGDTGWEEVYVGPDNFGVRAIELAPNSNDQIIYAGTFSYNGSTSYIKSYDQGQSWENIDNGVPVNCCQSFCIEVDALNPNVVYAGTGHYSAGYYIMKTEDGGNSWNSVYSATSNVTDLILDPDNNAHIYASMQGANVVMSNNGGENWRDAGDGLPTGAQMSRFSQSFEVNGVTKFYLGSCNCSAFVNSMDVSSSLNPPNNVVINIQDFNDVKLTWLEPDLTSAVLLGYKICRDGDLLVYISNSETFEYLDSGLNEDEYAYSIAAVYLEGESALVELGNIVIEFLPPADVEAWSNWPNIIIQWSSPNRDITSYNIYRDNEFIATTSNNFYPDVNVPAGSYVYNVSCLFTGGFEGPQSENIFVSNHGTISNDDIVNCITALNGNYPNPFNPETKINFSLAKEQKINIGIYNEKGQRIKELINNVLCKGIHSIIWDGTDNGKKNVSSGIYFCIMETANNNFHRKLILLK